MPTPTPLVSFCFTTYKRHNYLLSTLKSVQKQTFNDFEVIISDNDPDSSGKEVVQEINDSRFKYYSNFENLGMKKSFNKSLERSSGEYIVMIAEISAHLLCCINRAMLAAGATERNA